MFNDFKSLQWATGHEPFHGANGLDDQKIIGKDGEPHTAYKFQDNGVYFNLLRTRDPLRAARNPDNLVDFAN